MKIQPQSNNAITIIMDDGREFQIRDTDNCLEIHSYDIDGKHPPFKIQVINLDSKGWVDISTNNWIRLDYKGGA